MTDWKQEAMSLYLQGVGWSQLTKEMKEYFPNLTELQVRDKVRDYIRTQPKYKTFHFYNVLSIFWYARRAQKKSPAEARL